MFAVTKEYLSSKCWDFLKKISGKKQKFDTVRLEMNVHLQNWLFLFSSGNYIEEKIQKKWTHKVKEYDVKWNYGWMEVMMSRL